MVQVVSSARASESGLNCCSHSDSGTAKTWAHVSQHVGDCDYSNRTNGFWELVRLKLVRSADVVSAERAKQVA